MMNPLKLRDGILNLAFSGKLVKNHTSDDSLFEKYTNLLNNKIKNGSKSEKNNLKMDVELPYELPTNWFWGKLKVISKITYGYPFNSQLFNENQKGMPLIRIRNILSSETTTYTTENASDEYIIKKDDMLVGMDGNFNVNLWNGPIAYLNQRTCKIVANEEIILQKYLYYFLPIALDEIFKNVSYVTVKHLSDKHLSSMIIPIPPLEEQKNIVSKIEEILPLIEKYKLNWEKIENVNKNLSTQLKGSILKFAMMGKLVKQNPNFNANDLYCEIQNQRNKYNKNKITKKQKIDNDISEEELPFEIPDNWKWTHFNEIAQSDLGKTLNKSKDTGTNKPYLCSINVYWNGIDLSQLKEARFEENELNRYELKKGDLLICEGGESGRCAVWNIDKTMYYQNALHRVRFEGKINPYFYKYLLEYYSISGFLNNFTKGVTIKHLVKSSLNLIPIPLPPLEEQQRIVSRIEELFSICDKLEKTLN